MTVTLEEIVANRRFEVEQLKTAQLLQSLPSVERGNGHFLDYRPSQLTLICEIKPKSPQYPDVKQINIKKLIEVYSAEAAAISVLTETRFFGGSYELLAQSRQYTYLPLLCKDFVVDAYQCLLARACGAQAVLLIAKILDDNMLSILKQEIENLGMVALIEVQNKMELQRALDLNPTAILINNRNLDTFEINLATTIQLAPLVPNNVLLVSASGLESRAHLDRLMPYCSVFLVGSVLMHAGDPTTKLAELRGLQGVRK